LGKTVPGTMFLTLSRHFLRVKGYSIIVEESLQEEFFLETSASVWRWKK